MRNGVAFHNFQMPLVLYIIYIIQTVILIFIARFTTFQSLDSVYMESVETEREQYMSRTKKQKKTPQKTR